MKKSIILFSLLSFASFSSHLFATSPKHNARDVLNNYLDASLKGRSEEAYSYISSKDQAKKSLGAYLKEKNKQYSPLDKAMGNKESYKIIQLEETGNTASAVVEHRVPNFESVVPEILSALFTSVLGDKKEQGQLEKVLAQKMDKGIPIKTEEQKYLLIKEQNLWKVVLGWKSEYELREQTDAKLISNSNQKWQTKIQIDEMTDAKIGTITSPTIKGINFQATPYSATIQCQSQNASIDIAINWGKQINVLTSNVVQYRFDREKMFEVNTTSQGDSTSSYITIAKDKSKIIELMKKKKIMRVKHAASQVGRFSLTGFASAFQEACGWWGAKR